MPDMDSGTVVNKSSIIRGNDKQTEAKPSPRVSKGMVRFASTQEVLTAPSGTLPLAQLSDSASFKDSSVRHRAQNGLDALMQGNKRFLAGHLERCRADKDLLEELADWQTPIAAVLACADSRVPPELIFDQGLGDLFVVRVSGNCVNDIVMGSLLMAVKVLNVRLIVVLGHSRCHMIASAVKSWAAENKPVSEEPLPLPTRVSAHVVTPVSAFASATPAEKEPEKRKSQGFFARMCCGAPEAESPAPSAPSATPPSRASSNERSPSRRSLDRPSNVNPVAAILSAVQGSVETVARGSRANEFKDIASSLVGREDDDFSPNGGLLRTADSLGVTRMRLEKQRQRTLLAEIASMDGIEDVITENVRQSATLILKGIVKNVPAEVAREIEVVGAKYEVADGKVEIERRGWWSGRTFYWEKEAPTMSEP